MKEKIGLIYKITNSINEKVYIGSTINSQSRRWATHLLEGRRNASNPLHKSMNRHGADKFKMEVIFCTNFIDQLGIIEDEFMVAYNSMVPNGYNLISAAGTREHISDMMVKEWQNPEQRQKRTKTLTKFIMETKAIPIVSINQYTGEYKEYESVNEAVRDGFSPSGITEVLKARTKTGQEFIWLYKKDFTKQELIEQAKQILGGSFKEDFLKPIIGWNDSGEKLYFESSLAIRGSQFEPKAVRRVCLGKRISYKGYYWKFK